MPPCEMTAPEGEGCMDALRQFPALCRACFPRSEPRAHGCRYRGGPCSTLARTSIAPIAVQTEAPSIRARQRSLSEVAGAEARMRHPYPPLVADDRGEAAGVIIVDERGLPQKGQASAGVARQYWGPWGTVDHCQGGGFAASASRQG